MDFVLKLRKEAQLVDSSNEKEEETTEFPKIIWTMWQQGEAQMPETVQTSIKTIKDFAKRNDCEFYLLTDENLANFINIPADITENTRKKNYQLRIIQILFVLVSYANTVAFGWMQPYLYLPMQL